MFILEESQLLEDNIKDASILRSYKSLLVNQSSNDRSPVISDILSTTKCVRLLKLLLEYSQINGNSITHPLDHPCPFTSNQKDELSEKLEIDPIDLGTLALIVSAALTQLFTVDNFAGPTNQDLIESAYKELPELYHDLREHVDFRSLSQEGSEVYHRVTSPWLLRLAYLCWDFLKSHCPRRLLELEFLVWRHRSLTVHLMIFLEPSEKIVNELRRIQEHIFDHYVINDLKSNQTQLARFNTTELCCELAQSTLLRDGVTFARKFLDYACEASGISIEQTGILGKRTKFQQNNIPQLVIKVHSPKQGASAPGLDVSETVDLPKDIILEDDTLLPDISFLSDDGQGEPKRMAQEEASHEAQLILLARFDLMLKSEVMEESLKDEWTLAYLRSIIKSASIWSIKFKALVARSKIERKHMRRVDRALLQMEELIKLTEVRSSDCQRLKSFYSVLPLSSWQMRRSLGDMAFELSLYKDALDVYSKIEYWEGIIKCYCALGQTVKAEEVIRQELSKKETPYLYCLLGDVTENLEYYEKSWSLSNSRFSRAKKSMGTYFYVRKQYAEAIDNYELALTASPSNLSILSLLAYSCLIIERYERAAECYRNITYIDDTNFLAWNNLSKAYIKLNQKERAWRTLREAIKCNYEEWKIWENFMLVSIEIGALDDVITAWHRILDLKSSHRDDQMLGAITHDLLEKLQSTEDAQYIRLLDDALKLVARLISTSDCSPRLWICYSKLLMKEYDLLERKQPGHQQPSRLDVDARVSKITNALQRATPITLGELNWFQSLERIDWVLEGYHELADCFGCAIEILGPRSELRRQWKYFKLSWSNVLKTLNKQGYNIRE